MVLSGGLGESASHGYLPGKSAWTARTAAPLRSRRLNIHSPDSPSEVNARCAGPLDGLALQAAPLTFGHTSPDTEPLVMLERILQALGPDLAAAAHPLGLPGRSSLFREERLRICLCAQRLILPAQFVLIIWADEDLR